MKVLLIILGAIALLCATPVLVMWLWNWIAVDMFNAPVIGFWQACGIYWLSNLLFGRVVTVKRD